MYNDFIILGPKEDPAGVKSAKTPAQAFGKIAGAQAPFVSRGDNSGTHSAEKSIWKALGTVPTGSWYKEAGQGMEQVIIMASGMKAYTLADRATWLAVKDKTELVIVNEGDRGLFNPYGVILVNPAKNPAINAVGAKVLMDWLTSARGQGLIASFAINGQQLFFPSYGK